MVNFQSCLELPLESFDQSIGIGMIGGGLNLLNAKKTCELIESGFKLTSAICRDFLEGHSFHVLTDHKPLVYALHTQSDKHSPRQAWHLDFIRQFTSDMDTLIPQLTGLTPRQFSSCDRLQFKTHNRIFSTCDLHPRLLPVTPQQEFQAHLCPHNLPCSFRISSLSLTPRHPCHTATPDCPICVAKHQGRLTN